MKEPKSAIDSLRGWMKAMAAGFVISLVAVIIAAVLYTQGEADRRASDKRAIAAAAAASEVQRVDRTVESCRQYNQDQTRNRVFAHEQIFALARLSGREVDPSSLTPDIQARLAEYDQFAAEQFPYRQCSRACAVTYYDRNLPDCPPATTEEGT